MARMGHQQGAVSGVRGGSSRPLLIEVEARRWLGGGSALLGNRKTRFPWITNDDDTNNNPILTRVFHHK